MTTGQGPSACQWMAAGFTAAAPRPRAFLPVCRRVRSGRSEPATDIYATEDWHPFRCSCQHSSPREPGDPEHRLLWDFIEERWLAARDSERVRHERVDREKIERGRAGLAVRAQN